MRNDMGNLWENFLFIERLKKQSYQSINVNLYFWRTWDKSEIDLIEERDGALYGYEFKWSNQIPKPSKEWKETYQNAHYTVINQSNYIEFLCSSNRQT